MKIHEDLVSPREYFGDPENIHPLPLYVGDDRMKNPPQVPEGIGGLFFVPKFEEYQAYIEGLLGPADAQNAEYLFNDAYRVWQEEIRDNNMLLASENFPQFLFEFYQVNFDLYVGVDSVDEEREPQTPNILVPAAAAAVFVGMIGAALLPKDRDITPEMVAQPRTPLAGDTLSPEEWRDRFPVDPSFDDSNSRWEEVPTPEEESSDSSWHEPLGEWVIREGDTISSILENVYGFEGPFSEEQLDTAFAFIKDETETRGLGVLGDDPNYIRLLDNIWLPSVQSMSFSIHVSIDPPSEESPVDEHPQHKKTPSEEPPKQKKKGRSPHHPSIPGDPTRGSWYPSRALVDGGTGKSSDVYLPS